MTRSQHRLCPYASKGWDVRGCRRDSVRYNGSEQCSSCSIVLIILMKEMPVREKDGNGATKQNCGDFKGWEMHERRYSPSGLLASPNHPLERSRDIAIGGTDSDVQRPPLSDKHPWHWIWILQMHMKFSTYRSRIIITYTRTVLCNVPSCSGDWSYSKRESHQLHSYHLLGACQ
jgi:hypothetical protein